MKRKGLVCGLRFNRCATQKNIVALKMQRYLKTQYNKSADNIKASSIRHVFIITILSAKI